MMLNSISGVCDKFALVAPITTAKIDVIEDIALSDVVLALSGRIGDVIVKTVTSSSISGSISTLQSIVVSGGTSLTVTPTTFNSSGTSTTFTITFAPTINIQERYTLLLTYTTGATKEIVVYTESSASLLGVVSSLDFGTVVVNQSTVLDLVLTNLSASTPLVINAILSSDTSLTEYSLSGLAGGLTIPVGESRTVQVTFTPKAATTRAATIILVVNGDQIPIALTGLGTDANGNSNADIVSISPDISATQIPTVADGILTYVQYTNSSVYSYTITSYSGNAVYPETIIGLAIQPQQQISVAVYYQNSVNFSINGSYDNT